MCFQKEKIFIYIHPGRLTWNLRIHPWKRNTSSQTIIFRFYANLRGCICPSCDSMTAPDFGPSRLMEARPLAASAAGGSVSSAILWILHEALRSAPDLPPLPNFDCRGEWHVSFWLGLVVGFFLWPVLELLVLTKQWITLSLRSRIAQAGWQPGKHYKLLS